MERFPAIPDDQLNPAQRSVATAIAKGPRGSVRGPFLALLHSPMLAERIQTLGEYLRFGTKLPAPLFELAVLVTARHWSAQYEWFAHESLARKAGVSDAIITAIAEGRTPTGMSADETLVHTFATQVFTAGSPDDATFNAARDRFGLETTLDLTAVLGYYSTIAMVLNVGRIQVPDGPPPLKPLARR